MIFSSPNSTNAKLAPAARRAVIAIGVTLFAHPALACDPAAATTATTYCFVSEVGGCGNLPNFLATHQPSFPVTLVIDEQCGPYNDTLTLPGRMTLAGVGRDGNGELLFRSLDPNEPALAVAAGQGHVQIRDLLVRNISNQIRGIGLHLDGNSMITLNGVRIDRFSIGVAGNDSYSVHINQSNISNNSTNLWLGPFANSWRVRDSVLSQAEQWSVRVAGPNNDVLFDGNRLESNHLGAFILNSFGAVLSNNRLEFNGAGGGWNGIRVMPAAQQSRLLNNNFSTDIIVDNGADTRCAFNINVVEPLSCL